MSWTQLVRHRRSNFIVIIYILQATIFYSIMVSAMQKTIIDIAKSMVIVGPSGVGKSTIISSILKRYPNKAALSVSDTTRKPRKGEIDGVHYNFIDKATFEANMNLKYIEYARVHDNLYGTRIDSVHNIHDKGKVCILDVDVNGVQQLKACNFEAKYVIVKPPSMSELEKRLRGRGQQYFFSLRIYLQFL